jgi:hypothetical protein
MLYFDVFFAFGDFLMRVEKMEGKVCKANGHFSDQEGGKRHHDGMKSRFVAGSNLIFLFCKKNIAQRRRRNPFGNLIGKTLESL